MQIHDLNTKALTNPAYVAFDDGEDTYKTEFNECVKEAAETAVAETDLTQNSVDFTSGDAESPTTWTNVPVITTRSTLATLFIRISTMVKNVRYIWSKIGTTDISGIGDGTVTGALSTLNGNLDTVTSNIVYSPSYCYAYKKAGIVYLYGHSAGGLTLTGDNAWHSFTTLPVGYRPRADIYFMGATVGGAGITFHVAQNGNVEYITSANTSYWNYGGSFPI